MPVYNGSAYLAEAIESILVQTLSDLEIVAINDGSEDESGAILEGFHREDDRVRPITVDHQGIVAALNHGCRESRAEYVAIAHADDLSHPERLERQADYLDENDDVAVVGCFLETIDVSGNPGHLLRFPTEPAAIRRTLPRHNCMAHPSTMFRRSVIVAVGGYRFDYVEDYDLWLRVSERFDLANLDEVLVRYRIHPGQISLSWVNEMERRCVAVRAAARARGAGRPDPLADVNDITPAVLDQLGVSRRALARAVRSEWLSRTAILAELDSAQAHNLLAQASDIVGGNPKRSLEAARNLLRAESCLAASRPLQATGHVMRALVRQPVYTSSRLATWLGHRARGAFH